MEFNFRFTSTRPMLLQADTLADPLKAATKAHKELTSNRKKTDDIHLAIQRSEWMASLYFDPKFGPVIPGDNVYACLIEAAKLQKLGVKAKQALDVSVPCFPLEYDGPRDAAELYELDAFRDVRSVKVQQARVIRSRPIFRHWAANVTVDIDEDIISPSELRQIVKNAGARIGLGTYRPKFGRFDVEELS